MRSLLYFALFLTAAGLFAFKGLPYLMADDGCAEYAENLASCTPHECRQTIKGKRNVYGRANRHSFKREIIGKKEDPYFARMLCHVVEIDNLSNPKAYDCQYTEDTREKVIDRSRMLFVPENSVDLSSMDNEQVIHLQLLHMKRIPEQQQECQKISRDNAPE